MSSINTVTVINFNSVAHGLGSLVKHWEEEDKAKRKKKKAVSLSAQVEKYYRGQRFNQRWKEPLSIALKIAATILAVAVLLWRLDWELMVATILGSMLASVVVIAALLELVITYAGNPVMWIAQGHLKRFNASLQELAARFPDPNAFLAMSDEERKRAASELLIAGLRRHLRLQPDGHPTPKGVAQWERAEELRAYLAAWGLAGEKLTPYFVTAKERGPEPEPKKASPVAIVTTPPLVGESDTAAA